MQCAPCPTHSMSVLLFQVVEMALVKLQLKEHADKPVSAYSGGNRRKLSTAIALLARPPVVFLVSVYTPVVAVYISCVPNCGDTFVAVFLG